MGRRGGCHESTARCSVESLDQGHSCREQNQFCHDLFDFRVNSVRTVMILTNVRSKMHQESKTPKFLAIIQHRSASFSHALSKVWALHRRGWGGYRLSSRRKQLRGLRVSCDSRGSQVPKWCPSGAQVVPGHQDPEYRSTHQLIDLSSFEALSGNTLQQLANEKLTASWQISLGFHDFHGKAHTINCFLYWIWNDMDYIWILLPVSCSPVFQVECAACTLDTAIYLGTTCAASSATAVLTATTTLGARMTGGRGSRDFTKIQNSFQQYLTLFDFWILLACVQCVQFHL